MRRVTACEAEGQIFRWFIFTTFFFATHGALYKGQEVSNTLWRGPWQLVYGFYVWCVGVYVWCTDVGL